jgi:hypothetical protein
MYEEPTLKQTFGTEYESFRTNVPRYRYAAGPVLTHLNKVELSSEQCEDE